MREMANIPTRSCFVTRVRVTPRLLLWGFVFGGFMGGFLWGLFFGSLGQPPTASATIRQGKIEQRRIAQFTICATAYIRKGEGPEQTAHMGVLHVKPGLKDWGA